MDKNENKPLSYTFLEINKLFINNVKQEATLQGINPTYRYIFMCLQANKDGLTQSDICEMTHLKAPSISLILQQMEKEGLIVREKSNTDNRITIVKTTQKGQMLDLKLKEIFVKSESLISSALSDHELNNMKHYLEKIINNLKGGLENV